MIIFKKKTIHVDLFTNNSVAYEYAPIELASHFYPEWWKAIPKSHMIKMPSGINIPGSTMRGCAGFIDLYRFGFILPLWSDLMINIAPEGNFTWQFADNQSSAEYHGSHQAGSLFKDANITNIKLISPWIAETRESIRCHVCQPEWSQKIQSDYLMPPANVELFKGRSTEVNLFLRNIKTPRDIFIPFGTPMIHYIPLDDRQIKLHRHLISGTEYNEKKSVLNHPFFNFSYFKKQAIKLKRDGK